MPLTWQGSWPEVDFIASPEVHRGRFGADHPVPRSRQARSKSCGDHYNDEGVSDEYLAKL